MTADAIIDYDSLQLEALRGLVRTVLVRVAKSGLPGDHHLYISFDVRAPGVILSKRLREKYPSEMTIVLQHRFWDLAISDERFEVKLTFDGIPERLVVPFAAIKVFLDPSVRYVLHFEEPVLPGIAELGAGDAQGDGDRSATARSIGVKKPRTSRPKTRAERDASPATTLSAVPSEPNPFAGKSGSVPSLPRAKPAGPVLAPMPSGAAPVSPSASTEEPHPAESPEKSLGAGSGQVVSLDAFRKK